MRAEFTKEDTTSENMKLKGETTGLDKEFVETLTGEGGPLASGTVPHLDLQNEKNLVDSVMGGAVAKAKAKARGKKEESAEPVQPKTLKETLGYM